MSDRTMIPAKEMLLVCEGNAHGAGCAKVPSVCVGLARCLADVVDAIPHDDRLLAGKIIGLSLGPADVFARYDIPHPFHTLVYCKVSVFAFLAVGKALFLPAHLVVRRHILPYRAGDARVRFPRAGCHA